MKACVSLKMPHPHPSLTYFHLDRKIPLTPLELWILESLAGELFLFYWSFPPVWFLSHVANQRSLANVANLQSTWFENRSHSTKLQHKPSSTTQNQLESISSALMIHTTCLTVLRLYAHIHVRANRAIHQIRIWWMISTDWVSYVSTHSKPPDDQPMA